MKACGFICRIWLMASALFGFARLATAAVTNASFVAYLTNGSLAGLRVPVQYSYDAAGITGGPEDYLQLLSFDFNLGGTQFSITNLHQGGQAIFQYGKLYNVTAEFYPSINGPAGAPVNQIAFGFGEPQSIGYSDTNGQYGGGFFSLIPSNSLPRIGLRMYGGYAGLTIAGTEGATYVLKCSTNPAGNWAPLATNKMAGSNWFYLDPGSASYLRRFYTVEIAP
jgi:hypothetical protein